jgi:hypothetical protein
VREGTSVDGFPTRNPLKFDAGGLVGGIWAIRYTKVGM